MIHQCFLTKQALNVLVWNVEGGEEAIKELNKWLQNLQVPVSIDSHELGLMQGKGMKLISRNLHTCSHAGHAFSGTSRMLYMYA